MFNKISAETAPLPRLPRTITPNVLDQYHDALVGDRGACPTLWRRIENDPVANVVAPNGRMMNATAGVVLSPRGLLSATMHGLEAEGKNRHLQAVQTRKVRSPILLEIARESNSPRFSWVAATELMPTDTGVARGTNHCLFFDMSSLRGHAPVIQGTDGWPDVDTSPDILHEVARLTRLAAVGQFALRG
jgi:hypothetical protein